MKKENFAMMAVGMILVVVFSVHWSSILDDKLKDTGDVKVAVAKFDYHQTLEWPDGTRREFCHTDVHRELFEEGATVRIWYRGDGGSCRNEARIEKLVVVHSKRRDDTEAQDRADAIKVSIRKMLTAQHYRRVSVYTAIGANDAVAEEKGLSHCDVSWSAVPKAGLYHQGVGCEKDGEPVIVITEKM